MIAKGYKVFPWKLCQSKNSVCDESPPKRRTVAETFAWRLEYTLASRLPQCIYAMRLSLYSQGYYGRAAVRVTSTSWSWGHKLHWRHNERDGVSNHQPHDCLVKRLFRHSSKKTSKLRVTGLCEGNSPVTSEFPAQRASNAENVSTWWRHKGQVVLTLSPPLLLSCHHMSVKTSSHVTYHLRMNTVLNAQFFRSMSGRGRRWFLPASEQLRSVHPMCQHTLRLALSLCTVLSIGFALEPIRTMLWHARECTLPFSHPCAPHATTTPNDDDKEDIWAVWSVVINSWWHHDLETLSAIQVLTKGQ